MYKYIKTEINDKVLLITLNRPDALNALSPDLMGELSTILNDYENDNTLRCAIITGSKKSFAAGADIKNMMDNKFVDNVVNNFIGNWKVVGECRKPIIAAVSGYALGGGCELAMMCDFILASENAVFGQPEINLGIIPGAGGTQRLPKIVGKSKSMEMVLTGQSRFMNAEEAERIGLVSRIVKGDLIEEALKTANKIAKLSLTSLILAKELVNKSFEVPLAEGLKTGKSIFIHYLVLLIKKRVCLHFLKKESQILRTKILYLPKLSCLLQFWQNISN